MNELTQSAFLDELEKLARRNTYDPPKHTNSFKENNKEHNRWASEIGRPGRLGLTALSALIGAGTTSYIIRHPHYKDLQAAAALGMGGITGGLTLGELAIRSKLHERKNPPRKPKKSDKKIYPEEMLAAGAGVAGAGALAYHHREGLTHLKNVLKEIKYRRAAHVAGEAAEEAPKPRTGHVMDLEESGGVWRPAHRKMLTQDAR